LCGHRFVTPNLWHSCGRYKISGHFRGKPPQLRKTFNRLVELARHCGPVTVYAQKTRIVIQARVRFASVVVRNQWLDLGLWLRRRVEHPGLVRVENLATMGFGLHFRLKSPTDADTELSQLIREAYVLGKRGRHR
jgi:hypothetical protein